MRLSSAMGVAVLSLGMANAAIAEETTVSAEKKAPSLENLIEPTSSSLEYRHYYNVEAQGDDVTQVDPAVQARANIGFNLLGKLDTLVIFGAIKYTGDQKLVQRRPQIISQLQVQKGTDLNTYAYVDMRTPMAGADTLVKVGLNPVYSATLATTGMGAFSLSADNYLFASTGADTQVASFKDNERAVARGGLTLKEGTEEVAGGRNKAQPDLEVSSEILGAFVPTAAPKLKVKAGVEVTRTWSPVYDYTDDGAQTMTMAGTTSTINRFVVSYKVTDVLSLSNTTDHNHNGFYQSRVNGSSDPTDFATRRLLNFTTLSYTLF